MIGKYCHSNGSELIKRLHFHLNMSIVNLEQTKSQIEVKAKAIDFLFCFHKKKASDLKPFSSAFIGALKRMIGKKRVRKN